MLLLRLLLSHSVSFFSCIYQYICIICYCFFLCTKHRGPGARHRRRRRRQQKHKNESSIEMFSTTERNFPLNQYFHSTRNNSNRELTSSSSGLSNRPFLPHQMINKSAQIIQKPNPIRVTRILTEKRHKSIDSNMFITRIKF